MALDERLSSLVEHLLGITRAGKVKWQPGSTNWAFLLTMEGQSISISDSGEMEDGIEYTATIRNSEGLTVGSVTVTSLDTRFDTFRSLWNEARASSFGADEILSSFEDALRKLEQG